MEVFEDEESVGQGEILSDDFMYWTGYLFKVWSLTYPEETPADIFEFALRNADACVGDRQDAPVCRLSAAETDFSLCRGVFHAVVGKCP